MAGPAHRLVPPTPMSPRLLRYPRGEWRLLLFLLGLGAALAAVAALQPWPLKLLVDQALGDQPPSPGLARFLENLGWPSHGSGVILLAALAGFGLVLLGVVIEVIHSWVWTLVSQRMVYRLAGDLFYRFQRLSLMFHRRQRIGDLLSRLTGDAWAVATLVEALILSPGRHVLTLLAIGLLAWQLDPSLTAISLALGPLLALASLWLGPRLRRTAGRTRTARASLQSLVHETLGLMPMIQAYGMEARQRQAFDELAEDVRATTQAETIARTGFGAAGAVVLAIGTGVVLLVGGRQVLDGRLTLGSLLVFVGYLRFLQSACQGLLNTVAQTQSARASLERVTEMFAKTQDVPEHPQAQPLPATTGQAAAVTFDRVSFGYETGRPVLRKINLAVEPGEIIALVGESGAGKSTLVSLIPRLFDPWSGQVRFDGHDLRELQLQSLRARVSVLLQEPFLLPLTVAQNIAYSRPAATRAEVVAAATAARADEFIRALPSGYDTPLTEQGARLSGGQRQRLAVARAFLRDAPLLILDEPTAALDPETEQELQRALSRLVAGRTVLIIAHRFSFTRLATRIVVLDRGEIVETGRHAELLAQAGIYHRLYSLQATGPAGEGAR